MAVVTPVKALNMDASQQMSFISFHHTLPEKPPTCVRIFSRDDIYTVHGDDAFLLAQILFKTTISVKMMNPKGGREKLEYLVLSRGNFENALNELLLVRGYRVEVYTRVTPRKDDWVVEYKGSPGNLCQFEAVLFNNSDDVTVSSIIMAVKCVLKDDTRLLGVAFIDLNVQKISVCEFIDNELFTELEALIVQQGPKECVIPVGCTAEIDRIKLVLQRNNIAITKRKQNEFNDSPVNDLNRLVRFPNGQQKSIQTMSVSQNEVAFGCLNALIKYLTLTTDASNFEQYTIDLVNMQQFVHLDASGLISLNIVSKKGCANTKEATILGLLNRCRTNQGHRLLAQWITRPLRDINLINERLDLVETFVHKPDLRIQIYDEYLRGVIDLQTIAKRLSRKKATLKDCYRIYQTVQRLENLLLILTNVSHYNKSVRSALYEPLNGLFEDMQKFQEMVEEVVDMDAAGKGEYLLKATVNDQLQHLAMERDKIEEKMQKVYHAACCDLGLESSKVKLEQNDRSHYLRVTLRDDAFLRKSKTYKILETLRGGVKFTTGQLEELHEEYAEVLRKYASSQADIVEEFVTVAGTYTNAIINLNTYFAKLDVFVTLAHVAASAPKEYVRPRMIEGGKLILKQARHPCIELHDSISYIPSDVYFDDNKTLQIITGPNMGGKSTYIRSVGVIALMAHIGSFVPCDEATIPVFDAILARIGADDAETKGLSTFMVEMIETASVITTATKNSLIMIDELGRGTSTYEGCAIAWAITEHLAMKTKAFTLFATHFYEITRLADECANVVNRHASAVTHNDQFTLLYEIRDGACDKSFGIHLARILRFPDKVIEHAVWKHAQLDPSINMPSDLNAEEKRKIIADGQAFLKCKLETISKLATQTDWQRIDEMRKIQGEIRDCTNEFVQSVVRKVQIDGEIEK